MQCVRKIFVIFTVVAAVTSSERSVVISKKSAKSSDQEMSGSEYSFTMNSDGPSDYEAFKNANYNPELENYGMPPVIPNMHRSNGVSSYGPAYISYDRRSSPYDNENFHVPVDIHYDHLPHDMMSKSYGQDVPVGSYGLPITFSVNDSPHSLSSFGNEDNDLSLGYPSAPGYHGPSNYGAVDSLNYVKDSGKRYGESHGSSQGQQGETGFRNSEEFDKGLKSNFQNDDQKKFFSENGGTHADHFNSAGHYANRDQASQQQEGGSFSEDKGHNKGSKTTGYHKVFYKDEFKKDHEFYDVSDKRGEFERYGNKNVENSSQNGQFNKGGSTDSGYQNQQAGAEGFSNKGQSVAEDSKYNKEAGNEQFRQNVASQGSKGGESETEENGFRETNRFGGPLGYHH